MRLSVGERSKFLNVRRLNVETMRREKISVHVKHGVHEREEVRREGAKCKTRAIQ